MAGAQDLYTWIDHFIGSGATIPTSADPATPWVITDTSSAGTPTYTMGTDLGESSGDYAHGEAVLSFDSTAEAQNVCLSFGDALNFDVAKVFDVMWRVRQGQATIDAATSIAFGVAGDRDDAIDSIANQALFRLIGSNTVVVESDDGTNNNDDVATGQSLTNSYKLFKISFAQGLSDVRFFMGDGENTLKRVAAGTTFDMSNYGGGIQPYLQLQKTSDANTDSVRADLFRIRFKYEDI